MGSGHAGHRERKQQRQRLRQCLLPGQWLSLSVPGS